MIAVWIFVSNSSNLAKLHLRVLISTFTVSLLQTYLLRIISLNAICTSSRVACMLLGEVLTGKEQHLFVKPTDNGYFRLLLLSRFNLSVSRLSLLLRLFSI